MATLLAGCLVLLLIVGIWFAIYFLLNPDPRTADGKARITGKCGDTMEIGLTFKNGRVVASSFWTDGCVYSLNCVSAAAELTKGKTPQDILDIDAGTIETAVGGLSPDHYHCAGLATETLHCAVDQYMKTGR